MPYKAKQGKEKIDISFASDFEVTDSKDLNDRLPLKYSQILVIDMCSYVYMYYAMTIANPIYYSMTCFP